MSAVLKILTVDDEDLNLDILQEYFEEARYTSIAARDGAEALKILEKQKDFDVIVLDRMMPVMDGMQFLKEVKDDKRFRDIPVIMQTAASQNQQIAEGIKQGVFYYLSKPYTKDVLLSTVRAANDDHQYKRELKKQISEYGTAMSMIKNGVFSFRSIEQAKMLAILLGSPSPEPELSIMGLIELMVNAVEHGNLDITYDEKKQLKIAGKWELEVERRLYLPENKDKFVEAEVCRTNKEVKITIRDQGKGFDWKKYSTFDQNRLNDPNGRGIAMTMASGFDRINYQGNGNTVECILSFDKSTNN
ncbi:MAG: response regulator [Rickettsiales bacterium]